MADALIMYIVTAFAVIAFLAGYLRQDFSSMMTIFGSGVAVAFVVSVPDWTIYNKNPLEWLPPKEQPSKRGSSGGGGGAALRRKKHASWSNLWGVF